MDYYLVQHNSILLKTFLTKWNYVTTKKIYTNKLKLTSTCAQPVYRIIKNST